MGRYRDEPREPPHSCPVIDGMISTFEQVRTINSDLREWGGWWEAKAKELQEEVDELEREKDKLETKIRKLEEELSEQDEKIGDLEEKIETLQSQIPTEST